MNSGSLEKWRSFFRSAPADVFEVIEHAILVAASDYPEGLRARRDRIAERLFSCRLAESSGCERMEVIISEGARAAGEGVPLDKKGCVVDEADADGDEYVDIEGDDDDQMPDACGSDNVCLVSTDREEKPSENSQNPINDDSIDREAEQLTDEIEEAFQTIEEVTRLKDILLNHQSESESELYEAMLKLQLLVTNMEVLKATEIGKTVNLFRKHSSEKVSNIARILISSWVEIVDQWYVSTQNAKQTEGTPESYPSTVDDNEEEGLPSPPLDDGMFFTTDPSGLELSQLFDGMDDDCNLLVDENMNKSSDPIVPKNREIIKKSGESNKKSEEIRKSGEFNKKSEARRKSDEFNKKTGSERKPEEQRRVIKPPLKKEPEPVKKELSAVKPQRQMHTSANIIPPRVPATKRSLNPSNEKLKNSDEASVQKKLEATKRKLQESYHQAEIAKKRRTTQVVELKDIPKATAGSKYPPKPRKNPLPSSTKPSQRSSKFPFSLTPHNRNRR